MEPKINGFPNEGHKVHGENSLEKCICKVIKIEKLDS